MRSCVRIVRAAKWRTKTNTRPERTCGCVGAAGRTPNAEWRMIFHVVGVSFQGRQDVLQHMERGDDILLVKEPNNEYDPFAVSVRTLQEEEVGYIPAKLTSKVSQDVMCGQVDSIGRTDKGLLGLNVAVSAMKLSVEMVPESQWGCNLRSWLPKTDWDTLRKEQYEIAHHKCEVCGGKGAKWPVECHEKWEYDPAHHVQKLVGLIALCPRCHQVKHLGRTMAVGQLDDAIEHLQKVNGIGRELSNAYIREVFGIWKARSAHEWKLDLSWLKTRGVAIPSMETRPQKVKGNS
mmetsp:Transcript_4520/g.28725  ORF Transcript_4520/g.28725 Transcript_4520/m.28725 type:complete len:291 (+) Transcript_4520:80-952(+)